MGKLFLSENKFQKIKVDWSNGRVSNRLQKGNVKVVFTEIPPDSPEYKTNIDYFSLDPWATMDTQVKRENFIANVVIDDKVAFSCTVADLFSLQRALTIYIDRASAHLQ